MKPRIRMSENNMAYLACIKKSEKSSKWSTVTLPLISNIVAGLVAAVIFIWLSNNTEKELREIEFKNAKSALLWSEQVSATQENMEMLANLHNFIKYDLKESVMTEIKDGRVFDDLSKHSVQPLLFKGYMVKHREVFEVTKSNSPMLSSEVALATENFLISMERSVTFVMKNNFDPKKLFPIEVASNPEYPESAYDMASTIVDEFEIIFFNNFRELEKKYRESLLIKAQ